MIPFDLVSEELATQVNKSQSKIIVADENLIPVASAAIKESPSVQVRNIPRFFIRYAHLLYKGRIGTILKKHCDI